MNLIAWLVGGGILGLVATAVIRTGAREGFLKNVLVGIGASLIGGWLISPLLGGTPISQPDFSMLALVVSLGFAIAMLMIVNLIPRVASR